MRITFLESFLFLLGFSLNGQEVLRKSDGITWRLAVVRDDVVEEALTVLCLVLFTLG